MSDFVHRWGEVYNKSILAFTGRNKVAVRELEHVVNGTSGLLKSLDRLDKLDPGNVKLSKVAETLVAFKKEMKVLDAEAKKYAAILDTAGRATDKGLFPQPYREVKVIRKHLDWVVAAVNNVAVSRSKAVLEAQKKADTKIEKKTEKLRKKEIDDEQIKIETNFFKQQKMMANFGSLAKTAFAKAAAAVQKIKADPTPRTYNTAMEQGGRDMTQQMGNVIKLISEDKCPRDLVELMRGLPAYRDHLAEFGNGDKRAMEQDATKAQVEERIKEFSTLMKAMVPYYENTARYLKTKKL